MASTSLSPLISRQPKEVYHLFGFPIAHSVSPALHNYLFSCLGLHESAYQLTPTSCIGNKVHDACQAEEFGGASVTMPLKVIVASVLDGMTDEARTIGAVNTVVRKCDDKDRRVLVGTNTDWLGIRNALLRHFEPASFLEPTAGQGNPDVAGMVIGSGGSARAAIYALAFLKCTPIYLVGRDMSKLESLVNDFPQFPCVPISDPGCAVNVKIAVGCIPAVSPITPGEIAADTCTRAIFSSAASSGGNKLVFLEMCYKPRTTPLMAHAVSAGWTVISGIEAVLEQGLSQARMWLAKSVDPRDSEGLIPPEIEEAARTFIREMPDIIPPPDEVNPVHGGENGVVNHDSFLEFEVGDGSSA